MKKKQIKNNNNRTNVLNIKLYHKSLNTNGEFFRFGIVWAPKKCILYGFYLLWCCRGLGTPNFVDSTVEKCTVRYWKENGFSGTSSSRFGPFSPWLKNESKAAKKKKIKCVPLTQWAMNGCIRKMRALLEECEIFERQSRIADEEVKKEKKNEPVTSVPFI